MLEKEFQYYLDNQDKIVEQYEGTHIVIVGEEVVGAYGSTVQAFDQSVKRYEAGTFLIQYCSVGDEAYTQQIYVDAKTLKIEGMKKFKKAYDIAKAENRITTIVDEEFTIHSFTGGEI